MKLSRVLFVASAAFAAVSAQAYLVELHLAAYGSPPLDAFSSGYLSGSSSVAGAVATSNGSAAASGLGLINMGSLHLTLDGSGTYGLATGGGQFQDTVSASGLPDGSHVIVRWSWMVTGAASSLGSGQASGILSFSSQSYNGNSGSTFQVLDDATTSTHYAAYNGGLSWFDVDYQVGQNYIVQGLVDAKAGSPNSIFAGLGAFDYGNSAHAYAEVLTPGATLSSESGHSYFATAVPAPGSMAVVGAGFLVAFVRRRSRTRVRGRFLSNPSRNVLGPSDNEGPNTSF